MKRTLIKIASVLIYLLALLFYSKLLLFSGFNSPVDYFVKIILWVLITIFNLFNIYKLFFTEEYKYNISESIILVIFLSPFVSFLLTYIFVYFGRIISSVQQLKIGTSDSWISFFGSITGGLVTMIALYLTIRNEDEKKQKEMNERERKEIEPLISLSTSWNVYYHDEWHGSLIVNNYSSYPAINFKLNHVKIDGMKVSDDDLRDVMNQLIRGVNVEPHSVNMYIIDFSTLIKDELITEYVTPKDKEMFTIVISFDYNDLRFKYRYFEEITIVFTIRLGSKENSYTYESKNFYVDRLWELYQG